MTAALEKHPRLRGVAIVLVAFALAGVIHAIGFGSWQGFHSGVDFNQDPFEDFAGPYHSQAVALVEGRGLQPGFLYPPTLAIWLEPLGHWQPGPAAWIWLAVLAAGGVALFLGGLSWLHRPGPALLFSYSLAFGLSFPWVHDMHWGQVSTLVWALTIWALRAWCLGHRPLAALGLSLAISIKLYPAWFLLAFLLVGDRKGLVWVGFLSALWLFGLPATVIGPEATLDFYTAWWDRLRPSTAGTSLSSTWWHADSTQFAPAVLARFWKGAGSLWLVMAWVLPLVGLGLILHGVRRCLRSGRFAIALVLLASALPLVLHPSWVHYFVWLPWALFFGWQSFGTLWARGILALGMALGSTPFFFLVGGHPAYGRGGFLTLAALCLPLAYWLSEPRRNGGEAEGAS
ncbi:MAG: DUF2029 domain-containing protein [Planctomycetes bacterium]|nr:DUF2029 domain-containing protein [Planctomycetota bacterium]